MSPKKRALICAALVAIMLVPAGIDLLRAPVAPSLADILLELLEKSTLVAVIAGVVWTMQGITDLREGQTALSNNLARAMARGDEWRVRRQTEIAAFGEAIADQFKAWSLTTAEIDIAGLMLKGASLKEIALARDTSEATIRQQAQSIYRKSGLSGRVELSAYFLESLFATAEDAASGRAALTLVSNRTSTD